MLKRKKCIRETIYYDHHTNAQQLEPNLLNQPTCGCRKFKIVVWELRASPLYRKVLKLSKRISLHIFSNFEYIDLNRVIVLRAEVEIKVTWESRGCRQPSAFSPINRFLKMCWALIICILFFKPNTCRGTEQLLTLTGHITPKNRDDIYF